MTYKRIKRSTPWGTSDSARIYERGVTFFSTPRHGGYLVAKGYAKKHLSAQAQELGSEFGNYLAYEEDCLATIVDYELLQRDREKFVDWFNIDRSNKTNYFELVSSFKAQIARWLPEYTRYLNNY